MHHIRTIFTAFALSTIISITAAHAQKVEYKSNTIIVDGQQIATVNKIKDRENFGLTSTFELLSLDGKKLVIATVATDFVPMKNDNSSFYYRLTFLPSNQVGVFTLSKLWGEKSFAKLIGESGIVSGNQLDEAKVNEFIALKGKHPKVQVTYDLVKRNRIIPAMLRDHEVSQGGVLIGRVKDVSNTSSFDAYEFSLPSGLVVAKVTFTGGNSAKNCLISTFKDEQTQEAKLTGAYGELKVRSEGVDRNQNALEEITRWLVSHDYL